MEMPILAARPVKSVLSFVVVLAPDEPNLANASVESNPNSTSFSQRSSVSTPKDRSPFAASSMLTPFRTESSISPKFGIYPSSFTSSKRFNASFTFSTLFPKFLSDDYLFAL